MDYSIDVPVNFSTRKQFDFLKGVAGLGDDATVVAHAIAITAEALRINAVEGLPMRVLNKTNDGFSEFHIPSPAFTAADAYARMTSAPKDDKGGIAALAVHSAIKEQVAYIKKQTGLKDEAEAVGLAVQMTYDVAKYMKSCKNTAFICFTNDLNAPGMKMKTVFDKTLRATFGAATRKARNKVASLMPRRSAPKP